jgi:hypothetical protein
MNHCFISVKKNNIAAALEYYASDVIDKEKFSDCVAFLPDSIVLHHKKLFIGIEVYIQSFALKGSKLDYYGKTIIPVESAKVIKKRMESDIVLMLKVKINKDLKCFYKLLQYAIENEQYIVHLGI